MVAHKKQSENVIDKILQTADDVIRAQVKKLGPLAGLAVGTWGGWDDIAATWRPKRVVEPSGTLDRERWKQACDRAAGWIPELSSLAF